MRDIRGMGPSEIRRYLRRRECGERAYLILMYGMVVGLVIGLLLGGASDA